MKDKQYNLPDNAPDLHSQSFGDVLTLTEALQKLCVIKGINAAFVVDNDGLIVSGLGMDAREMENIGGLINARMTYYKEIGEESNLGDFEDFVMTFSRGKIFSGPLSSRFIYALVGDKDTKPEKVNLMIEGYRGAILAFLGGH